MIDGTKLRSSLTKVRVPYLRDLSNQLEANTLSPEDQPLLLAFCLRSYSHYQDSQSRSQVANIVRHFIALGHHQKVLGFIAPIAESDKSIALTDLLTLLTWCSLLIEQVPMKNDPKLLHVWARVLDMCLEASHNHGSRDKRIFRSIVANTKLTLSKVLTKDLIDWFISSDFDLNLVSLVVATCVDLQPTSPELHYHLATKDTEIIEQFNSLITASFPKVPNSYSLELFGAFTDEFVNATNATDLLTPFEKLIMKNSELSLGYLIPRILQNINHPPVKQAINDSKFIAKVLNGLKNTKETVRSECYNMLVRLGFSDYRALIDLAKTATVDSKVLIYKLVAHVDFDNKESLLDALVPIIKKDMNEQTLTHLIQAFVTNYFNSEFAPTYQALVNDGSKNKKPNLRSLWFTAIGNFLEANPKFNDVKKVESLDFAATISEFLASPLILVNSKGVSCIFVSIYIIKKFDLPVDLDKVFVNDKIHVISIKIFSKLTEPNDLSWGAKLLEIVGPDFHKDDYGFCWLYLLASSNAPSLSRNHCLSVVSDSQTREKIAGTLIDSTFDYLVKADTLSATDDLNLDYKHTSNVLKKLIRINNSPKLTLVANYEPFKIKNGWIGLTSLISLPIEQYITENFTSIYQLTLEILDTQPTDSPIYRSAIVTMGQLCFVVPKLIIPQLISSFKHELDFHIDDLTFKIWQNDSEFPVVNVLKNSKLELNKNSKDYETQKWEMDLRQELKKVSKEDQKLVNQQKAKEDLIKRDTQTKVNNLIKDFNIINELVDISKNFNTDIETWFPSLMTILTGLFENFDLINRVTCNLFSTTFIHLSTCIWSNFDLSFKQILFRIKFLSDQMTLDFVSMSYLYPMLIKILSIGYDVAVKSSKLVTTSEFVNEDPKEEQLLLAIEILNSHAEIFASELIPRYDILNLILKLIKLPSKSKMAKDCFMSVCSNISLNFEVPDLKILLDSLITSDVNTKLTILEVLDSEFELPMDTCNEIWITLHDNEDRIASVSQTIWSENSFTITEVTPFEILESFSNEQDSGLRLSIATSIFDSVKGFESGKLDEFLQFMFSFYDTHSKPPPPKLDEFGLVIKSSVTNIDQWEMRSTVALTLKLMTPLFNDAQIARVFKFLINEKALNDKNELVRQELQDSGIEIISYFSLDHLESLVPIFESSLETITDNNIKESIIILYGSLGKHFDSSDNRINIILDRLIVTLKTPSENVQIAISKCLASLVHLFETKFLRAYVDRLFDDLFDVSHDVSTRKGAAYGIAGVVKGLGIKALQDFDVMRLLGDAVEDKKSTIKRESVSLAYECLSFTLGKFFEPYVIEILPNLLKSLGDQSAEVRLATDRAAKIIMSNTTSFGVKKLIPLAISHLDETAWRSKKGSVELLGSMAYLDPAQLSSSLSIIIPEIVGVLNDTHKEVRKAADLSLKRFGEVIRNPEIQRVVPDLIKAIGDPTRHTDAALDKLIKTQFVHYIDGPSLALIIHVIHRGMKDRSASTKRKACQIVGNMAILVDTKDLKPYLNTLIQELEISMVDPVPATRSTAARALGSLVEKLGEEQFPDLIPKLLGNLQDEAKAGDRLGSAQALAEVICGLGLSKLDELLPVILSNAKSSKSFVRAGFMPLLLYLPVCFGSQFAPYLSKIIPPILNGLADTDEEIRDMALRSGRLIVRNYAKIAIDLLLPELENGLNDVNYRIRLSSVELTGDLLFQVTGISGKNELIDGEDLDTNNGEINKSLISILGKSHRDTVLALLFMCRSDVNGIVRNKAVEIWKALVANTPKMVKEILPALVEVIIKKLASDEEVEKTIAANTMGEMVKRVGAGNSLSQVLPNLLQLLESDDANIKEGVCIALTELIKSTSEEGLIEFQDIFIEIVYKTLMDESANVRNASAVAFDTLQTELGKKVIDEIIPNLLNKLESNDSEYALLALQDIMSTKSDVIFPILIPTLLSPPIDNFKVGALSSLASVAGNALYRKLTLIINTLMDLIIGADSEDNRDFIKKSLDKILASINDQDGVNPLMQTLLSLTKHEDYRKRAAVFERLAMFFENTNLDYSVYLVDMVQSFILSLGDKSAEVVKGTFEALSALIKAQPKESLEKLAKPAQQSLMLTGVKGEELDAFKLPKGPNCILPIFLQGLMYGNSEQREVSAMGIADIVEKTPGENLRPFSTVITGPLIRVIGEKVNSNIKASILMAINNLLLKIPQFLRPFIPQLQRTFVRLLSDPNNDELRNRSVEGLGILIKFQPRIDSLIIELISGCKNSDVEEIKLTMLKAILEIVQKAGDKLNESSKQNIMSLIEDEFANVKGKISLQYAKLLGTLSKILSVEETETIVKTKILTKDRDQLRFSLIGLNAFLKESSSKLTSLLDPITEFLVSSSDILDPFIGDNSAMAIGKLLLCEAELSQDQASRLVYQLCKLISNPDVLVDTKRISIIVLRTVGRLKYDYLENNLDLVIPVVFNQVRSMVIPVKLAAEKCYLSVLKLTETEQVFNTWFDKQPDNIEVAELGLKFIKRSIGDYTKRVAVRLAKIEVERIEQGGDEETLFSDRIEDEQEIWSIGGI
ncbi:ARM repeat-containing protein [Yamadazyma tenuis ATCC 10573]|uniref:ARM repeat-containing protein n=1 Tax=Candida tenuis (strain ATCC 10573 / BCRC 21748 / CBS 615 / JCM 9827 / NBRC 10315 / NRRL Y-1498 / VKM Y-70) TaxID=590646 RepID=G3B3U3_CANTC|nr:ARM repeat-containing protein [Yamadazyma tenuis ATCC 10573]EGV63734.1 ARM repeat-containing protein [Yamadazyma tenuis ATCC 10573]